MIGLHGYAYHVYGDPINLQHNLIKCMQAEPEKWQSPQTCKYTVKDFDEGNFNLVNRGIQHYWFLISTSFIIIFTVIEND